MSLVPWSITMKPNISTLNSFISNQEIITNCWILLKITSITFASKTFYKRYGSLHLQLNYSTIMDYWIEMSGYVLLLETVNSLVIRSKKINKIKMYLMPVKTLSFVDELPSFILFDKPQQRTCYRSLNAACIKHWSYWTRVCFF